MDVLYRTDEIPNHTLAFPSMYVCNVSTNVHHQHLEVENLIYSVVYE